MSQGVRDFYGPVVSRFFGAPIAEALGAVVGGEMDLVFKGVRNSHPQQRLLLSR